MRKYNLQFRYLADDRRWEDIPRENKDELLYNEPNEIVQEATSFLKIWNLINRNTDLKIEEIRVSSEWNGTYRGQGYYITDWNLIEKERELRKNAPFPMPS